MVSNQAGIGPSSRVDVYGWDGTFLRSFDVAGVADLASVDGAYIVDITNDQIWSSTGTDAGPIDVFGPGYNGKQGRGAFNWAGDGDYFCALDSTGTDFALLLEDVGGKQEEIPLIVPSDVIAGDGIRAMQVRCSLSSNRAAVWKDDQPQKVAIFSVPDGTVTSELDLGSYIAWSWSSDLRWLLAHNTSATGPRDEVIDTESGAVMAQLDGNFESFAPDGQSLVGTDAAGNAVMVDWRNNAVLWSGTGHLETIVASSDASTDEMLLWLSTGSDQAGTTTYDYWIVNGVGAAFRFTQKCSPSVASAARCY